MSTIFYMNASVIIVQWFVVLILLAGGGTFKTKKEVLLNLIPFYWWSFAWREVKNSDLVNNWRNLK